MGFGYGPGNEMQRSSKGNRALVGKRKSLKELQKENGAFSKDSDFKFKEPTDEEMKTFRIKLQRDIRSRNIRRLISVIIAVLLGAVFLYLLIVAKY